MVHIDRMLGGTHRLEAGWYQLCGTKNRRLSVTKK